MCLSKRKKPSTPVVPCPLGVLIVIVKDSNGKPVLDVKITAGNLGQKKTNKDGIADYGKVETGIYTVKAKRSGHAPKRNDPEGEDSKTGINIIAGSTTTVNLIQHPICANVSFFEGSTARTNYFGFDHRTNQVVTLGTDEYWLPTPASGTLTLPTDKQTRDGGRWVSVAVGKETEVEINFAFKTTECIPCITNSTFEVKPATIAEVVTVSVTAKKAIFKIKGKAEGEASLKVICDGNDIGWFHIWSKNEATLQVIHTTFQAILVAINYPLSTVAGPLSHLVDDTQVWVDKFQNKSVGTNPTHSQLAKDHDDHHFHELAAILAQMAVRAVGDLMYSYFMHDYKGNSKPNEVIANPVLVAKQFIAHPLDVKWMDSTVKAWANANPDKILRGESTDEIDHIMNIHGESIKKAIDNTYQELKDIKQVLSDLNKEYWPF